MFLNSFKFLDFNTNNIEEKSDAKEKTKPVTSKNKTTKKQQKKYVSLVAN